ncbi:MAG: hypothetical protein KJZ68_10515, partial [Phycisphaerales bacterium]|nr:hypothetical protein [Phycisphaerales bacterium]
MLIRRGEQVGRAHRGHDRLSPRLQFGGHFHLDLRHERGHRRLRRRPPLRVQALVIAGVTLAEQPLSLRVRHGWRIPPGHATDIGAAPPRLKRSVR